MAFLDDILGRIRRRIQGEEWPPAELKAHWEEIEYYRVRYRNDAGLLIPYNRAYSVASFERQEQFTPVPFAREMARYSSSLLFSEPAKITLDSNQAALDELLDANGAEAFWQESAETIAVEGRGAFRIIQDDEIDSSNPLITFVNEDQIIWDVRHGRFVRGGVVVIEAYSDSGHDLYRMFESHEKGFITRRVYKGQDSRLGNEVAVDDASLPTDLQGFEDLEETGVDTPTLIRWDNVPGGRSDLFGIEVLLDRIDEAESLLLEKARKSRPWIFSTRQLADENGYIDISNIIFLAQSEAAEYLEDGRPTGSPVVHVQPDMQTVEHVAYLNHLQEQALTKAGYSLSSYGLGDIGTAESGTAIRLKQNRTLINRQGKERMCREAMTTAIAVALARKTNQRDIANLKPEIAYGDGMPTDENEVATRIQTLKTTNLISLQQAVRDIHPDWNDETVDEEVARIEGDARQAARATAEQATSQQPQRGGRLQALLSGSEGQPNGQVGVPSE